MFFFFAFLAACFFALQAFGYGFVAAVFVSFAGFILSVGFCLSFGIGPKSKGDTLINTVGSLLTVVLFQCLYAFMAYLAYECRDERWLTGFEILVLNCFSFKLMCSVYDLVNRAIIANKSICRQRISG